VCRIPIFDHTEAMRSTTGELVSLSEELAELVSKAVTGVVAVKSGAYRSASGVALREDLVAVAAHLLRREEQIPVYTAGGGQGIGTLLGRDSGIHAAFLKVSGLQLKPIAACDPAGLRAGMLAAVVGLTTDAGPTASLGILGAVAGPRRTWLGGSLDHFIRLDVNSYPSQAGAAVVASDGSLIGMATPGLLQYSQMAVPVSTLNGIADELLREGRIRRGYFGVGIQPVGLPEQLREKTGIRQESGLIVLSVEPDSPASRAGIQLGDILLALNEVPLADIDDLQTVLRGDNIGKASKLVLARGGERLETEISITERTRRPR
jgi:serine protease Do